MSLGRRAYFSLGVVDMSLLFFGDSDSSPLLSLRDSDTFLTELHEAYHQHDATDELECTAVSGEALWEHVGTPHALCLTFFDCTPDGCDRGLSIFFELGVRSVAAAVGCMLCRIECFRSQLRLPLLQSAHP